MARNREFYRRGCCESGAKNFLSSAFISTGRCAYGIFEPLLVEEFADTIRQAAPRKRRNLVDHLSKSILRAIHFSMWRSPRITQAKEKRFCPLTDQDARALRLPTRLASSSCHLWASA